MPRRHSKRFYPLVALLLAVTIILSTPNISQGRSWLDLLRQGVQVIQLSNLSDHAEVQIGQQINQQLLKGGKVELYRSGAIDGYPTENPSTRLKHENVLFPADNFYFRTP